MRTFPRIFFIVILASFYFNTHAQTGNIIVFSPKGDKFTLFIGSNIKNNEPANRVEADNPGGPTFKLKVVFPDPAIKEISKLIFNKPHATMFYKVEKNGKGAYTLESVSSEWTENSNVQGKSETPSAPADTPPPPQKETNQEKPAGDATKTPNSAGCKNPMSEPDFNAELVGISARPFEPMQLSAAKKMAETHCLMVSQVKRVIYIFDSESSRLSFAKFAFDYTYDSVNYQEVDDALHSEKSKIELDKFVSGKMK
jgi:hypothetical protein